MNEFCHIHVHSNYSILDAISSTKVLAERAKELGFKSIALTDHGAMHGFIEFYLACQKVDIKPIIGCEFYAARKSIKEKRTPDNPTDHLLVLAKNYEGVQNLMKLTTLASTEGFHYTPRIDMETLAQYSSNLIATSSCMLGAVARLGCGQKYKVRVKNTWKQEYTEPNIDRAIEYASKMQDIFGKDNFFLEIQDHGTNSNVVLNECRQGDHEYMNNTQKRIIELVYKMAKRINAPIVATNDVHYTNQSDWEAKDTIFAIRTNTSKFDPNRRLTSSTDQGYLKSPQEMCHLFRDHPQAIANTLVIAEQCNTVVPMHENHIPQFDTKNQDLITYWRSHIKEGFQHRYKKAAPDVVNIALERVKNEIDVIEKMDFVSYFLMVADFIQYSRSNNIPVGPGRGSAAGSIVSYCLGITDLCPIEHNLIFERFLNSERISLPDIDIDFCKEKVDQVYTYAQQKYGKENVARIATFGSMWARSLIRTVGRAHDLDKEEINIVANSIPEASGEFRAKIADEIKDNETVQVFYERQDWKKALDEAVALEGAKRSIGKHAAGIVIGDADLSKYIPLMRPIVRKGYKSKGKDADDTAEIDTQDSMLFTQIPMDNLEDLGLIKMDFLALETLTIIQRAVDMIAPGKKIKDLIDNIDDQDTYELMRKGQTLGVFQVESPGLRDLLIKIQPDKFSDIVDTISLYRPGPIDFIDEKTGMNMLETYILRRNKKQQNPNYQWPVLHEKLNPILNETYGIIVYQEQIMQIVQVLCNYTLNDADRFRKAVGKKIPELVEKERQGFIESAMTFSNLEHNEADTLFEIISAFSRYGFNRSHAASYGLITYRTAWLKAHYKNEYMCALLTSAGQKSKIDDRRKYIEECVMTGIHVVAPDINISQEEFTVQDNYLVAGLSAIKGVDTVIESMIQERETNGKFTSFLNAIERLQACKCNKRPLEAMIYAGAMDSLKDNTYKSRAIMINTLPNLLPIFRKKKQRQEEYTSFMEEDDEPEIEIPEDCNMSRLEEHLKEVEYLGVYCHENE